MVNKRKTIASDIRVVYFKKSFDQRFMDSLGPTYFKSMPVIITKKKNIINKYSNVKMSFIKCLFMSLD